MKAAKELGEGQRCVVILPDGLRNYMTKFLSDQWMMERDLIDDAEDISRSHWYFYLERLEQHDLLNALFQVV